jgi:phosphoribosylanthranilate isomerase
MNHRTAADRPYRTRIKFCGITRPQDAARAVALGVDLLGFVLVPASPRAVSPKAAEAIRRTLPPGVSSVALFKDADAATIDVALQQFTPDWLQFHGGEVPEDCAVWGRPWVKAVAMKGGADLVALAARYAGAGALLLDGHAPGAMGGSGETFDWGAVDRGVTMPLIVAGGLHPDNVAEAIRVARPYAVDVSSGIESRPGIKDSGKMADFVAAVSAAGAIG